MLQAKYSSEKSGINFWSSNWQRRIQGFLSEGISHIFFTHNLKRPYIIDIVYESTNLDLEYSNFDKYIKILNIDTINRMEKYNFFEKENNYLIKFIKIIIII